MKKSIQIFLSFLFVFILNGLLSAKITVVQEEKSVKGTRVNEFPFYIYRENNCKYYYPTGWMGDYSDMKLVQNDRSNPAVGQTSIRLSYSGKKSQKKGWAGIYWQNPMNNWGVKKGGYDLSGAKRLYFYARGENGGETAEFKMGGITGNTYYDSASASAGNIELTKDWKLYSIDLTGRNISVIIGGFCVLFGSMTSPNGAVIYIDDIFYSDRDDLK